MRSWLALLVITAAVGLGAGTAVGWGWRADALQGATLGYVRPGWTRTWSVPRTELGDLDLALRGATATAPVEWPSHWSWYRLTLDYRSGRRTLYISLDHQVFCPTTGVLYPELAPIVAPLTARLDQTFFGEPLEWTTVSTLYARKSKVRVTDLDTGRIFWLYRYGGDLHADVEPASAEDAAIMRAIYGEWTWRRRAVIIELGGRRVAASLHAMPHGGGDIRDNDFDGHACLHFAGSLTHGSRRSDPAHQLMVTKAAGSLGEVLHEPDPAVLAASYLMLVAQKDLLTLELLTAAPLWPEVEELCSGLVSLLVGELALVETGSTHAVVRADVALYRQGEGKERKGELRLALLRQAAGTPWRVYGLTHP